MAYVNPENEYPRYPGDLLNAYPEYVEGSTLPDGWHLVTQTEPPICGVDETADEIFPVINKAGEYVQTFKIRAMTADEIARRDAPKTAKAKLVALGLTDIEIEALARGLIR